MKNVIVDGTTYQGVSTVQLETTEGTPAIFIDEDEAGGGIMVGSASGKVIHVDNAVADGVKDLKVYDSGGHEFTNPVTLAIANKNLFRQDLLPSSTTNKGIVFTKNSDGGVTAEGTSTGDYANVSVPLDKKLFQIGKTFSMSTGKESGSVYFAIKLTYSDNTEETFKAQNVYRIFTVPKSVTAAAAYVEVAVAGTVIGSETIWPMLELAGSPSEFKKNTYTTMQYDGTTKPTLPDAVSNLWSLADTVATMTMVYNQNVGKQADYLQEQNNVNSDVVQNLGQIYSDLTPGITVQGETMVILNESIGVVGESLIIR